MSEKPPKKFSGVFFDHYEEFADRADALDMRKILNDEGHRARFSKDSRGMYQVYAIFNEEPRNLNPGENE